MTSKLCIICCFLLIQAAPVSAKSIEEADNEFSSAIVHQLAEDGNEYRSVMLEDSETISRLLSFFPQFDRAGKSSGEISIRTTIELSRKDGTSVTIKTDLEQMWSAGKGVSRLKDAAGLKKAVEELFAGPPRLWPPRLDRERLVGAWSRGNGSDQDHLVVVLNNNGSSVHASARGPIDDLKEVDHVVRSSTSWRLRLKDFGYLQPSIYDLQFRDPFTKPDNRSSSPISIPVGKVTSTHLLPAGFGFPGTRYTRLTPNQAARLCELLKTDPMKLHGRRPAKPWRGWPPAPDRKHLVGTWVLRGNDENRHVVISLRDDGLWWKATIGGKLNEPTKVLYLDSSKAPWKIRHHDQSGTYLQFGDKTLHSDGSTTLPFTQTLIGIWQDRLIGGVQFDSIATQPTYERATPEQAKLLNDFVARSK